MAASARKLGRADATRLIIDTVPADPPAALWVSRAAQQTSLAAAERGVSARDGDANRRVQTLIDATTGKSVGVITAAQIETFAHHVAAEAIFDATLLLTPTLLTEFKQWGADSDLLSILGCVLGNAGEVTVALGD